QGHDLVEHTKAGHLLPVATVLSIGERVALALDHAHRQQVVHRDIKPANVMYDPATDAVKVTDFGIARITGSSKTKTGMVLGTPSFMSPEQLAGQHVDGRSDLYSMGATLFQLLTGALPLRGDSMAALMYQIANQPAPSVRTLRPELPQDLADILGKTLAKSPLERYQTGGELAADLRRVAAVLSPSADADGAPANVPVLAGRDDEDAMLATVVTPAPVSSMAAQSTSPDIRL
ncbi:MAG: serine/threonine-protein kinase, partial [Variovorax sp.]|nr:serine/threonine-protein kinase [Variovorax sp.]